MSNLQPKPVKESAVETNLLMMPMHSNPLWDNNELKFGNVNGGTILNLIDNVAGIAALRHCRTQAVTASIDRMDFLTPVHVGELLILKASVNYTGKTSFEVGVRVEAENLRTGERRKTGSAYLTFVALDENGNPTPVPPVIPETPDEKRRYEEAKQRRQKRLEQLIK